MIMMSYRDAVTVLAGHKAPGETQERWLERAATRAGLSFRTMKALFYGETTDPPASVDRALELALAGVGAMARGARHDLARLEARIEALERLLARRAPLPLADELPDVSADPRRTPVPVARTPPLPRR